MVEKKTSKTLTKEQRTVQEHKKIIAGEAITEQIDYEKEAEPFTALNKAEVKHRDKPKKVTSKKGREPWKPAQLLSVRDKTPGFRYRWCDKDMDNIRRKEEEGWIKVSSTTSLKGEHDRPVNTVDGAPLCRDGVDYREVILMALPEERGLARDEYQAQRVREHSHEAMRGNLERETGKLGTPGNTPPLHGGISFD